MKLDLRLPSSPSPTSLPGFTAKASPLLQPHPHRTHWSLSHAVTAHSQLLGSLTSTTAHTAISTGASHMLTQLTHSCWGLSPPPLHTLAISTEASHMLSQPTHGHLCWSLSRAVTAHSQLLGSLTSTTAAVPDPNHYCWDLSPPLPLEPLPDPGSAQQMSQHL